MHIEDVIKDVLINELFVEAKADEIGLEDGLRTVHGVDSLGFVELLAQCEERFQVEITDEEFNADNFQSVRALAAFIRSKQ